MATDPRHSSGPRPGLLALAAFILLLGMPAADAGAIACTSYVSADVVALDQAFFWNRLGAVQPQGMMYALRRDVVPINVFGGLTPGNVRLRSDKRPRPLVLRVNVGQCLVVYFQNLLATAPVHDQQPVTRTAGVHVAGMALAEGGILSDGSNVGVNPTSLIPPGTTVWKYVYYAAKEGTHLMYSTAANTGGEGNGGSLNAGLFGAVNVEPTGAEYYRSQVTANDLLLARKCQTQPVPCNTPGGQPIVDYDAVYPVGHAYAGLPILRMTQNGNVVHSDLTAIITGPNHGRFPAGTYLPNPVEPDRLQPFREFTTIYHDETGAVQAFPEFNEGSPLQFTLHSVRDSFAINYGSAGAGAEVLANRLGVGPMHSCTECLYEEFFLTSWAVADPAMVVDVPANTRNGQGQLILGPKATKAFYPDDPTNVHHSYMRDHVKFRVLHGGSKEHHIHHLHAHQWLRTPDSDNSAYLDSQAFGPASAFTTEIAHNGSGNRNQTPGDSIYHCHFYPHFAQGMWALWRVHDTFESGSALDANGRPISGTRALPDAEIVTGTPIPAVVPLPTLAMAPIPTAVQIVAGQVQVTGTGNPGFPFFVPGVAGHRPPTPPLDIVDDGGLPRHVITAGTFVEHHTPLDFDKELTTADAFRLPEAGTAVEQRAMQFHETRLHPSFTPENVAANFVANGLPRQPGAPFADPCITDAGQATGNPRTYKGANIQLDIKLNKAGWHFKQSRILTLWDDVAATLNNTRPPEPLFFRANSGDCITYHHANLVPKVYEQDDFQVRTPTDVIGQHIHLVKFDVMAADGAGNGFNYEDGTLSPEEVLGRIGAINAVGGLRTAPGSPFRTALAPVAHPFFGVPGARTTVQRWYADDVTNNVGTDRTLRTVFTHDHYGPSTHQQVGLYAGLVIEPKGSTWRDQDTGAPFGTRFDGGPTSWRADIIPSNIQDAYREFLLEFADFQLAYTEEGKPVNPPGKQEIGLPFLLDPPPFPKPEAISADDPGTYTVNYRNEPIALRVRDPLTNTQAAGDAGDLSKSYSSTVTRADAAFNAQPNFYPPLTPGVQAGDPFTPLIRAYENDKVQVRVLVGAHEEGHNFEVHGQRWLMEPSEPNSGYRASQMMGISEHYEFVLPPVAPVVNRKFVDYLYKPGASVDDQWNGLWGLIRVYSLAPVLEPPPPDPCYCPPDQVCPMVVCEPLPPSALAPEVAAQLESDDGPLPLPNNQKRRLNLSKGPSVEVASTDREGEVGEAGLAQGQSAIISPPAGVCPTGAPVRAFRVSAVAAAQAIPGGTLVYNSRPNFGGALHDPTAILYVRNSDLDANGQLLANVPIEPLVLRAQAGDCIAFILTNRLPAFSPSPIDLPGFNTLPMIVSRFNANQVLPSRRVGLHAQLVHYDVTTSDGWDVGFNPEQTVAPGNSRTYWWYAGLSHIAGSTQTFTPVEFGGLNLNSSDPIKHSNKGAIGALVIEPQGSTWVEDAKGRASATVTRADSTQFRDFVLHFQNDINLRNLNGAIPNLFDAEDFEDTGAKALNYRTEPIWKRVGFAANTPLTGSCTNVPTPTRCFDYTNVLSNAFVGGDPQTPVFVSKVGMESRFHVVHSGGHPRNEVFMVHGHRWLDEPWTNGSTRVGFNPLSEWGGATYGHGPSNHLTAALLPQLGGAGGPFGVTGDFLYRTFDSFQFTGGQWGIFRVTPAFTPLPEPDPNPLPEPLPASIN